MRCVYFLRIHRTVVGVRNALRNVNARRLGGEAAEIIAGEPGKYQHEVPPELRGDMLLD